MLRPSEGRRALASATALATSLLATALLLPSVTAMPSGGSAGPAVSIKFASFGSCAGIGTTCTTHPAGGDPAGTKYLVLAFVHGPTGASGAVSDSVGDTFHLVSTCWLDNGIFGHTAIFESNVTLRSPASYAVNMTPPAREEAYLKVALAFNQGRNDRTDVLSNTCVNHWTRPSYRSLPASFATSLAGDLTIYLWVLGQANGSQTPVSCGHGSTILMSCGSTLSGPSYNRGLSWPAFARETFSTAGVETASITISGGGSAVAPCPWDVSYVALTAYPPSHGVP
jgi:hypothetical protein